nr:phosphatase PAP2 family protein [Pseudomonas sp.]
MSLRSLFISLGDSAVAIPLALAIALALALQDQRQRAAWWLLAFGTGIAIIAAGKLAFEFFGWSVPAIDMYVISGHAMLTAAVYPMLFTTLARPFGALAKRLGLFMGLGLAGLMGIGLVWGRFHTVSETVLGALVGLAVASAGHWSAARLHIGPAAVVALIPLLLLAAADIPSPVHAAKQRIWRYVAAELNLSERHIRYIRLDKATGEREVMLRVRPIPPARPAHDG